MPLEPYFDTYDVDCKTWTVMNSKQASSKLKTGERRLFPLRHIQYSSYRALRAPLTDPNTHNSFAKIEVGWPTMATLTSIDAFSRQGVRLMMPCAPHLMQSAIRTLPLCHCFFNP